MDGGFDKYSEMIKMVGAWGGNIEIQALVWGHSCPIITLRKRMPPLVCNRGGAGQPVFLCYDEDARRYEALMGEAPLRRQLRRNA